MLRTLGSLQQPVLGLAERVCSRLKPAPKPEIAAEKPTPIPPTPISEIDAVINALSDKAQTWADVSCADRAILLRECITTTLEISEEAATAATKAKGSYGEGIGNELSTFIPIISGLREYAEAMEANATPAPHRLYKHPITQQYIADVFPMGLDSLLFGNMRGELWLLPGKDPTQGLCYRQKQGNDDDNNNNNNGCGPGVAVVLGAGNQTPVAALDILHVLVATNHVVVCKMNPVNEYMGPFLRRAFQPLVDQGYVEFVYGGGAEGAAACNHPKIDAVHLTGSAATYDAIVWQGQPKTPGTPPPFTKHVSAELGCVTPVIIVPGRWSDKDLEYHADTVVTALAFNAGHNCLKAEIVVTWAGWDQRDAFLDALRRRLQDTPTRTAFYPGSDAKFAAFKKKFPSAEELGNSSSSETKKPKWLLQAGLSEDQVDGQVENWCGVLQEVSLPSDTPAEYLARSVNFANENCWGTLSCMVIAHPTSQRSLQKEFDAAIQNLEFGTICINVPGTIGFGATRLAWGGWPGASSPWDVGSGDAKVHNTLLFDHVQKSVLWGAWRIHPHPFWSISHRNGEAVSRGALKFMANPNLLSMLSLAAQAIKG